MSRAGHSSTSGLGAVNRLPMRAIRHEPETRLDGPWRFQLKQTADAPLSDAWEEVFVPELWTMRRTDDPPHYTNVFMPFEDVPPHVPARNPVGVYRTRFEYSVAEGRRTRLHVGAAEGLLHVAVNGRPIGSSTDSHLAAEFDITGALHDGGNEIELAVTKWSSATYIEDQDQWWQSGLSRPVHLYSVAEVRIEDVTTTADFEESGAHGRLTVVVRTEGIATGTTEGYRVRVQTDATTAEAAVPPKQPTRTIPPPKRDRTVRPERRFPDDFMDRLSITATDVPLTDGTAIGADGNARIVETDAIAGIATVVLRDLDVSPWSAETPHLTPVHVELLAPDGTVVDDTIVTVGFRTVRVSGPDLLVNGRRIMVQGVNRHDIDPRTGRVMSRERMRDELGLLKRNNVNAIRTSHYPNDPFLLDLCDELGLYVVAEADVEGHAFAATLPDEPEYLTEIVDRVARMVHRDRNHPCVITWSLGNETGYGAAHDAAAAWVRAVDPTRPVQYAGGLENNWYAGRRASDIACPMYASFASLIAYSHDPRGDRPLILSEYAYSQGNSTGGFAHYWALFESLPGLQGGFVWQFLDHSLDPDGDGRYRYGGDFGDVPNSGDVLLNGVAFADLTPKPALSELRAVFGPLRIVSGAEEARMGVLLVRNRRTFTTVDDLAVGVRIDLRSGPSETVSVDLPPLAPGESARIEVPDGLIGLLHRPDALGVTVEARTTRDEAWIAKGQEIWTGQVVLQECGPALPSGGHRTHLDAEGRLAHPLLTAPPMLSSWRALTDNELSLALDNRFVRSGLFLLEAVDTDVQDRGALTVVRTRYRTAWGEELVHDRSIRSLDRHDHVLTERVELPEGARDALRIGSTFTLVNGFDMAEWVGLGPLENYPDRRAGAALGRWRSDIDDLAVPYVRPQENGSRGGVTELLLSGAAGTVIVTAPLPFSINVGRYSVDELESADHWWQLPDSLKTVVHIDAAQRGVGTGRIGPDTLPRYRLQHAVYEWSWRLQLQLRAR